MFHLFFSIFLRILISIGSVIAAYVTNNFGEMKFIWSSYGATENAGVENAGV